ncbi:MAG: ATP-binding cassette domain-containing protein [Planctomycetales bacterium]|nr:ATP-binding cassette domain-containing protein [Planctomycetales bacterium]NIM07981.1 ATP-binding cassette domain-containing protein [Planctomycetales bacterium]NIN07459.1 ATP-binding cassette domain-containing protein [Planctomycetales bacterium]NIN76565.1 ATP-binding cassette domain-containing protein [Planctomycetales bacterium]NIO33753.1 ATP-binding cassette domain-containing protein [Planctomycetales bacterium]
MIEFENITRTYGDRVAVNGLNLTVPRGELFAYLGPNGAGKTTSIKMAVGLLRPTQGCVRVCGYDVVQEPRQAKQRISYVPDEPYLYDKLTGREFLRFIADMYGMSSAEADREVDRQVECFELARFVDDLTESYSHGMKQRLVFAAAMLHYPEVLVVDEPMVGLDPKSIRLVKDLLRRKAAEGVTVFMSTHTLAVAEEIGDRIGIIDHGRLLFVGTLHQLKEEMARHDFSLEQMFLELTAENGEADELGVGRGKTEAVERK